jgi:hypothetical protein
MKIKKLVGAIALAISSNAYATNAILQNEFVKAGVNESTGTFGSGGNTSPGLLYDSTGTSTFNTAYDYLTPGSPFDGFAVKIDSTNYSNNNAGGRAIAGAWTSATSTSSADWTGSFTHASSTWGVRNVYSLPAGKPYVDITSTVTAGSAATQVWFGRFIDPDARAAAGDSSRTDNVIGYGAIPTRNVVFSEALVSRYALGLYSTNTNVYAGAQYWTQEADGYQTTVYGANFGSGDDTIGLSWVFNGVSTGDILTMNYAYIFGPNAFGAASSATTGGAGGGNTSILTGTLTDVGSATTAASSPSTPPAPTVTGTSVVNTVVVTETINTSLPVLTASLAHHEASKTTGVQTIARETTTNITTPWTRATTTTPVTTTTYSDSTTTVTTGSSTTVNELFSVVDTTVTNDSFSGRADQVEQFDIIKSGIYRNLNRNSAKYGVSNDNGRMAINVTGIKYNGQNNYNASSSISGFAYETDINKDVTVGFQLNRISAKLNGNDTSNATLNGTHFGVYADVELEGFTIQSDLAKVNTTSKYNRSIGPFTNDYSNKTDMTWLSTRVYTPEIEGFRPFVGASVYKVNTPAVSETGSIQSSQTMNANNTTGTTGEVGVSYSAKVYDTTVTTEFARTTSGVKEAILNVSKIEDNLMFTVGLGKNWINNTTSNIVSANLKIKF